MKTRLFENVNGNQFKLSEDGHGETDMSDPAEKREVQIGKEIFKLTKFLQYESDAHIVREIQKLALELMQMHEG